MPHNFHCFWCKWIFTRKRNAKGEVVRYKARLVAQGFLQRPGIDFEEVYSPVLDATTHRILISFAVTHQLTMRMLDFVTAHLYGDLDKEVYMHVPEGFDIKTSH